MAVNGGRRKRAFSFLLVTVFLAVTALSVSCTDFFSTSLARWAARDPGKLVPPVTIDNVGNLISAAENNPDLSLEVLKKIRDAADKASGDEQAKLQAAALETASNAAGLGQAILSNAGKLTSVETEADARQLVTDAINSMKNLNDSSAVLTGIVPDPDTPEFDTMTSAAKADDLAMAALVIIAAEAKTQEQEYENGIDGYVDHLIQDNALNENENLAKAMALASTLESRQDELSSSLKDALGGLNLFKQPQPQS